MRACAALTGFDGASPSGRSRTQGKRATPRHTRALPDCRLLGRSTALSKNSVHG